MKPPLHIQDRLRRIGKLPGEQIRLADTALFLGTAIDKQARLAPHIRHLKRLCFDVAGYMGSEHGDTDVVFRAEALRQVLSRRYGYGPSPKNADVTDAANLIRLLDTRNGDDAALAVLYVHIARALGWEADAIDFPARVLVRLAFGAERHLFDPVEGFRECTSRDLRLMLKESLGEQAELTPAHYAALDGRALLLRLQDNLKAGLLAEERFFDALDTIENTLLFAPGEAGLWREAGYLHARIDNVAAAISALETFLRLHEGEEHRYRTSMLLQELRGRLQ